MNVSQSGKTLTMISQTTLYYMYIHVVQDVMINETSIVSDKFTSDISYYDFASDGYFILTEFKLPTTPGNYYYTNGVFIFDPEGNVITTEELLEVDPDGTSVVREDTDYVSMYYLEDYYLKLLKGKYLKNICACGCGCIEKTDKVKLDTLTMGLDLIEALLTKLQYYEVQRIAEKLQVCFGIVDNNCNCR